jgi:elongation factor G
VSACNPLQVVEGKIPQAMLSEVEAKRMELLECIGTVDERVMDLFLEEAPVQGDILAAAIRRATIARDFIPVFMGSAYKNVGIQLLLDGVAEYLPDPTEV